MLISPLSLCVLANGEISHFDVWLQCRRSNWDPFGYQYLFQESQVFYNGNDHSFSESLLTAIVTFSTSYFWLIRVRKLETLNSGLMYSKIVQNIQVASTNTENSTGMFLNNFNIQESRNKSFKILQ